MSETPVTAVWRWDELPAEVFEQVWDDFAAWVDRLEQEYFPWVVLPPCWPDHEALRAELALFWIWHDELVRQDDPTRGLQWHADLRSAAQAWRELSTCDHQPPSAAHEHIVRGRRELRGAHVAAVMARQRAAVGVSPGTGT